MAHLVLSSDDCSRYCSLPLSSPRYDYQIGSCRKDLHPGPFDLCRLSARTANSTCSWKKNQRDSQSLWLDLNLHRALEEFSENSKCYQHRAQRRRASSSFFDWLGNSKEAKARKVHNSPQSGILVQTIKSAVQFHQSRQASLSQVMEIEYEVGDNVVLLTSVSHQPADQTSRSHHLLCDVYQFFSEPFFAEPLIPFRKVMRLSHCNAFKA